MPETARGSDLERAVYHTVQYFDLFDQSLTATQLWRMLMVPPGVTELRPPRLLALQQLLRESVWLRQRLGTQWGYYTLQGRESLVPSYLRRHTIAQMKWKLTQRTARWLVGLPLLEMVAMSGSLAAANTREGSDLDLFVVVRSRRIWTARLLLLAVTQILGRRRRYWDREAPDKLCLNHYVTDASLALPTAVHHVYMAMLCRQFVPLSGWEWWQRLQAANQHWLKTYVTGVSGALVPPVQYLSRWRLGMVMQRALTELLAEPLWDWIEWLAERGQRQLIERHRSLHETGRVALSTGELAFHPGSRVPRLLQRMTLLARESTSVG